jgi:hypothetical protein
MIKAGVRVRSLEPTGFTVSKDSQMHQHLGELCQYLLHVFTGPFTPDTEQKYSETWFQYLATQIKVPGRINL